MYPTSAYSETVRHTALSIGVAWRFARGCIAALCFTGAAGSGWAVDPTGVTPLPRLLAWEGRTMGTFYSVKIAGVEQNDRLVADLRTAVEQRFDEINRHMSHYQPDSDLSQFNRSTSLAPFRVSADFAMVTRRALELNRASGGAFDPTLGWLINLWGFGPAGANAEAPSDDQIAECRRKSGAVHLRVTPQDELQKDVPELQLNLSAIAKGYGADEAARVLRERGYSNVLVSVCGEIVAFGLNPDGKPWRLAVERPQYGDARSGESSAVVSISDCALSTSGDAHNYFTDANGQVYSHILDPATGRPVHHNLASVTVIAPDGLTADGLATTLFVMGPDRGLHWIDEHPGFAALFIVREGADGLRLIPSKRFPDFQAGK
jgi:FAD:protein FMN transferase